MIIDTTIENNISVDYPGYYSTCQYITDEILLLPLNRQLPVRNESDYSLVLDKIKLCLTQLESKDIVCIFNDIKKMLDSSSDLFFSNIIMFRKIGKYKYNDTPISRVSSIGKDSRFQTTKFDWDVYLSVLALSLIAFALLGNLREMIIIKYMLLKKEDISKYEMEGFPEYIERGSEVTGAYVAKSELETIVRVECNPITQDNPAFALEAANEAEKFRELLLQQKSIIDDKSKKGAQAANAKHLDTNELREFMISKYLEHGYDASFINAKNEKKYRVSGANSALKLCMKYRDNIGKLLTEKNRENTVSDWINKYRDNSCS